VSLLNQDALKYALLACDQNGGNHARLCEIDIPDVYFFYPGFCRYGSGKTQISPGLCRLLRDLPKSSSGMSQQLHRHWLSISGLPA
jgi:hypothetical protein